MDEWIGGYVEGGFVLLRRVHKCDKFAAICVRLDATVAQRSCVADTV